MASRTGHNREKKNVEIMVGFSINKEKLTNKDYSFAGAASGAITRFLFQPLDVVKIRFQLQIEPISKTSVTSKYKGFIQAFFLIPYEEGIGALWKGHIPAQFLSILYGTIQFSTFEHLTFRAWKHLPPDIEANWKPTIHFFCGGAAGCVATVGVQPFDVLRTRLVAQGEPKAYTGMYHGVISIISQEGSRSLYKGLVPTLIQILPYTGAQFSFYKLFQQLWNKYTNRPLGLLGTTICASSAGIAAKGVVYPLDLIKKRIQIQGFQKAREQFGSFRKYKGVTDCFISTLREEGIRGLYKGFFPSVVKAAVVTASYFVVYEQIIKLLLLRHQKDNR
ncbi:mitochondrial thiamine pyrophosphate carrier-like isoform X2 [Centruroides sculpturatus]|uniref:mitochondrial thiamine pyrophosphate carrier-like isoform X2 n=1 Tax=Centruroides sculpturatus TaxID=218467 RepID=UPI000C6D07FA|nr:mitochondrial thiamine pyrophosphate carrier-like isoform X2 [Centruroides sculpturatus]